MNSTPGSMRTKIGIFGKTNSGKSSLINSLTSQEVSIVSEIKGTTTDPVRKNMELFPLGPVTIIDTAGISDDTELSNVRFKKTLDILEAIDIAIYVKDSTEEKLDDTEISFLTKLDSLNIPIFYIKSKVDLINSSDELEEIIDGALVEIDDVLANSDSVNNDTSNSSKWYPVFYSTNDETYKLELLELLSHLILTNSNDDNFVKNLTKPNDLVIMVIPIDESAPKGRLILPQQIILRELLDNHTIVICTQVEELAEVISQYKNNISLVITDSQAFKTVNKLVPNNIRLTSFSILMSKKKGDLKSQLLALDKLDKLEDGSIVMISEACTHHIQCNDIGTVKLPNMIKNYTNKDIRFVFSNGNDFDINEPKPDLIVHCGGCMISDKEMQNRIAKASDNDIPITNYGMVIAKCNNMIDRITSVFE